MKIKNRISKRLLKRLVLFIAIVGVTILIDSYLDRNPLNLDQEAATTSHPNNGQGTFYFYSPANTLNTVSLVQKAPTRFVHTRIHDKFLQKHHQLRNFHIFKAENSRQKIPLVLAYHLTVFRNYYTLSPDDVPLIV